MSDELISRVIQVLAATQRIPVEKVSPDSTFTELGMDSMDAVNVLFALENEFDINIPDDEVRSVANVRQMAEGIARLIEKKGGGAGAAAPVA